MVTVEATDGVSEAWHGLKRIPDEAMQILYHLASDLWGGELDPDTLEVLPLKGAMTNEVYRIKWPAAEAASGCPGAGGIRKPSRKVLVRLYGHGTEVFFDRDAEVITFERMSQLGQGPRLLGRFANGRIEQFINARTLSADDLRDPEISGLIAAKLREFHNLDIPGPNHVILWERLRNWLQQARNRCTPEESTEFKLNVMGEEVAMLEKIMLESDQNIGFCHNDLQYGNIMINEETRQVTLIDYEYAGFNPVAFDIANHFCEMAANYHTSTPHVLDFSKYPGFEEQRKFVKTYLCSSGEEPSDEHVQVLLTRIDKYTIASHLLWGLWGIISAYENVNIDFNYLDYARQRLSQYQQKKQTILGAGL